MATEFKTIVFTLAGKDYGIELDKVRSIEPMVPITKVPKTLPYIKGVINLRGVIIAVIDLRGRFGLPETEPTRDSRIIIVAANNLEVGLIVDSTSDLLNVMSDSIENPPEVEGGGRAKFINGVAKVNNRMLILLHLEEVLNRTEIINEP